VNHARSYDRSDVAGQAVKETLVEDFTAIRVIAASLESGSSLGPRCLAHLPFPKHDNIIPTLVAPSAFMLAKFEGQENMKSTYLSLPNGHVVLVELSPVPHPLQPVENGETTSRWTLRLLIRTRYQSRQFLNRVPWLGDCGRCRTYS